MAHEPPTHLHIPRNGPDYLLDNRPVAISGDRYARKHLASRAPGSSRIVAYTDASHILAGQGACTATTCAIAVVVPELRLTCTALADVDTSSAGEAAAVQMAWRLAAIYGFAPLIHTDSYDAIRAASPQQRTSLRKVKGHSKDRALAGHDLADRLAKVHRHVEQDARADTAEARRLLRKRTRSLRGSGERFWMQAPFAPRNLGIGNPCLTDTCLGRWELRDQLDADRDGEPMLYSVLGIDVPIFAPALPAFPNKAERARKRFKGVYFAGGTTVPRRVSLAQVTAIKYIDI